MPFGKGKYFSRLVECSKLSKNPVGRLLGSSGADGLSVTHTRDTDKGLLLYGLEQGGYVGSIDVKAVR